MGKIKSCILIFIVSFVLCVCSDADDDGLGTEIYRYSCVDEIEISHTVETVTAKITIVDTYTKNSEKYYEITTTVTGQEVFVYSEAEYDKVFGVGNDAFDCEIYSIHMDTDILQYEDGILGMLSAISLNEVYYFSEDNLIGYQDNPLDISYGGTLDFLLPDAELICKGFSEAHKECIISIGDYSIKTAIKETRYSFLGETDFTDEELSIYAQELDLLNRHVLDAFDSSR